MKLKSWTEADISAVRWINKEGKTYWAVEVAVTEKSGDSPTWIRANRLIAGKHFRNIGRMILAAAGFDVPEYYSDFLDSEICGNFTDGTKKEALKSLRHTWTCYDGTIPKIKQVKI
jgi:hypothetical protein